MGRIAIVWARKRSIPQLISIRKAVLSKIKNIHNSCYSRCRFSGVYTVCTEVSSHVFHPQHTLHASRAIR